MNSKFLARAKRNDRLAAWLINIGGLFVILSVIGILVLITNVAIPLFLPPKASSIGTVTVKSSATTGRVVGVGTDDYLQMGFLLDDSGTISFFTLASGDLIEEHSLVPPGGGKKSIVSVSTAPGQRFDILWEDGSFSAIRVKFSANEDRTGSQHVAHEVITLHEEKGNGTTARPTRILARFPEENSFIKVTLLPDDRLVVEKQEKVTDLAGNETVSTARGEFADTLPDTISALALDTKGEFLYAGTDKGNLLRWDLGDITTPQLLDSVATNSSGTAITAVNLVLGDISVAVGDAAGDLSTWFPVTEPGSGSNKVLTRIHPLGSAGNTITKILPSPRSKTLFSLDSRGRIHIDHMTSERHLLTLQSDKPLTLLAVSGRGNGVIALDSERRIRSWQIDNPHPEISFRTLFGPVWYENHDTPAYVWQSSSANDDFEPKLSLTPLIFGTLKGTLYAMIFAVPLALLGAIYTSQFMRPRLKKYIKPGVEIMAAIPSVVIGFLAGLWLAPLMDHVIVTFFLSYILVPVCIFLTIISWKRFGTRAHIGRFATGYEFMLIVPAIVLGVVLAYFLSGVLETSLFGGDFKLWLFDMLGVRYDQRNSMVIAFALGMAVIPIIFTIAEDALSNVPKSLAAASLAIGASRWQTAWRVVLPSALPGIFSAIMIGFGRAIGETMIVLMATGNTPIMDKSIFNGFRSLSANIAVEIPEAPVFGTLYRVLFFSAVLLFIFTFFINTVAEILRQQFRKKYGRF